MAYLGNLIGSILSFLFSFFIVLSYFLFKKLHSSTNRIILAIATADVIYNVFNLVQFIVSANQEHKFVDKSSDISNLYPCNFVGIVLNSMKLSLAFLAMWLATYLQTCLLAMKSKRITKQILTAISLKIFFISLIISFGPWITQEITREGGYLVINCRCQLTGEDRGGRWQQFVFLILPLVISIIYVVYSYHKIDEHFNKLLFNLNEINTSVQSTNKEKLKRGDSSSSVHQESQSVRRSTILLLTTSVQTDLETVNGIPCESSEDGSSPPRTPTSSSLIAPSRLSPSSSKYETNNNSSTSISSIGSSSRLGKNASTRSTCYANPISKAIIRKLAHTVDSLKLFPVAEIICWGPWIVLSILNLILDKKQLNAGSAVYQIIEFFEKSLGTVHGFIFMLQPRTQSCWKDFIEKSWLYDLFCGPKQIKHALDLKRERHKGKGMGHYLNKIKQGPGPKNESNIILELPESNTI